MAHESHQGIAKTKQLICNTNFDAAVEQIRCNPSALKKSALKKTAEFKH